MVMPTVFSVIAIFSFLTCIDCQRRGTQLVYGGMTAVFGFLAILYRIIPLEQWQFITLIVGIVGTCCGLLAGSAGIILMARDRTPPTGDTVRKAGHRSVSHPAGEKERTCP